MAQALLEAGAGHSVEQPWHEASAAWPAVGQRVQVRNSLLRGTIRYVGETEGTGGIWIGLELAEKQGMHSGTLNGQRYFDCKEGHGYFARAEQLRVLTAAGTAQRRINILPYTPAPQPTTAMHRPVPKRVKEERAERARQMSALISSVQAPTVPTVFPFRTPQQVSSRYPGLLVVRTDALFPRDTCLDSEAPLAVFDQLHGALRCLQNAALDPDTAPPSQGTRQSCEAAWEHIVGNVYRDNLSNKHRELTVPAPGLTRQQLKLLRSNTPSTPRGHLPGDGTYFRVLQDKAARLARIALEAMRKANAQLPPGIYYIGAQFTDSPVGTGRGPHSDPQPVAAALVTMTFQGNATITVDRNLTPTAGAVHVTSNREQIYMLTGAEAGTEVFHSVEVGLQRRLSLTLRYADASAQ